MELLRKTVSGIMLILLFISMSILAFNIQPVKSTWTGTVYIRADGSIDPPDAPIITYDNVTYTLTDNIKSSADGIVVERDNIVIDGAGYMLEGTRAYPYTGVDLSGRSNVTIKNTTITTFYWGIRLSSSSSNSIIGNKIANNEYGIGLDSSSNYNSVVGNNIENNEGGIGLFHSSNNSVVGNNIANNGDGISLHDYSSNNIIIGNNIANNLFGILLSSSKNRISGNNITNNDYGISLHYSSDNSIVENNIANNQYGISLHKYSSNNIISGNNITNNGDGISLHDYSSNNIIIGNNIANNLFGIWISDSSNNRISGNNITANNYDGISLDYYSSNNIIVGNNIANNGDGIWISDSSNNVIYHNNLVDNSQQVYSYASTNVWDDGYPSGGNSWSDYAGVDADGDGIGDTPYLIDDNNRDRYPLMGAFNTFDAGIWNGTAYNVDVVSNSIVSNFELNTAQRTISFNVASVEGVASFCRITIPNIIVQDLWQRNYTVLLNGEPWPYRNWTDNTSTYIYVNYTHPTHQITIIPELPSTAILTLLMLTTLTVTIPLKKKKTKPHLSLNFSLNVMRSSSLSSIPSLGKDAGGSSF